MPAGDEKKKSGRSGEGKGKSSEERAASKAANIAEREARKADRQRGKGKAEGKNDAAKAGKAAKDASDKPQKEGRAKEGGAQGAGGKGKSGQGKTGQGNSGQGKPGQGKAGQAELSDAEKAERRARREERKAAGAASGATSGPKFAVPARAADQGADQASTVKPDAAKTAPEQQAGAAKAAKPQENAPAKNAHAPTAEKPTAEKPRAEVKPDAAAGNKAPVKTAAPAAVAKEKAPAPVAVKAADPAGKPAAPTAKLSAPVAKPAASAAEPTAAAGGVVKVPPFTILIVAQAGRLARQAVVFAASLRKNAPNFAGRLVVAEPLPEGAWAGVDTRIPDAERALLTGLGAEIIPFTARHFGRSYPYGNKIEALAILPPKQPFIFFDTDTLVLGPIDEVQFRFRRPSASMNREGTWPEPPLYGPDFADIWGSLYNRFGLKITGSLDHNFPADHWEHYLYFNAGWFFGPDPAEFGKRFLDAAVRVRNEPGEELACQSLDPWLDQAVLPLVIHSLGGGRPGPELDGLDGAVTCHYRKLSLLYASGSDAEIDAYEAIATRPEIAALFGRDKAYQRLVVAGEGRKKIRPLFAAGRPAGEKALRQILKKADLWITE